MRQRFLQSPYNLGNLSMASVPSLAVSDTGYFVYCNGQDAEALDGRIEFAKHCICAIIANLDYLSTTSTTLVV